MVRTLNALTSLRPFSAAARRAASLLKGAGGRGPVSEPFFEALEERTLLAADVTATLTVPALTGLASAGGALSGSILLANTGNATATGFTYRVFLSTDSIIGNEDDVELTDTDGNQATLAASGTLSVNLNTFSVPTDVRPGAYFLITTLDTTNVVVEGESGEANNTVSTASPVITLNGAATGTSNLSAALTFTARTINPDQHITVPTTIRNLNATASGVFHITWVLSTDAVIGNADDIAIDEEEVTTLAGNGTLTITRDIQLPVGIALGAYRVGVWVDDRADEAESNEADNRAVTGTAALTVGLPDLSATFTTTGGTIAPGGFFSGTLTLRNNTQALATPFNVYICLSTDSVAGNDDDILLLVVDVTDASSETTGLAGGATRTISNLRVYIPYGNPAGGALNPGAYRVSVVVDPTNDVAESNESNNSTITATNIVTIPARTVGNDPAGADLFTYVYPISGSFLPGQTLTVATIFANLGNAQATGGVTLSAYMSTDAVFDGGDILLSGDVFDGGTPTFDVGSLYGNVSLVIPGNAPNGNFFVIFRADVGGTVTETNDANNTASAGTAAVTRGTVSITAPDAAAGEATTANPGQFRIARTGALTSDLVVMYSVTGTAQPGDYNGAAFTGMVTIPAGQSFVLLNLTPVDDALAENDETMIVTLSADPYYIVSATQSAATVTIADNEPRVSLTVVDAAAAETTGAANTGQFRFTRTGSTAGAMTVTFVVAGTAGSTADFTLSSTQAGADVTYTPGDLTGTIVIPAGQTSVTLNVNVTQDATAEPSETVIVSVEDDAAYSISTTQYRGTVTIADDEPTVILSVTDAAAGESTGVANPGQFRVTRPATNTAADLIVHYTVTGTATAGDDYVTLTGTVTIPAGQTFANFNVTVADDLLAEGSETVIVTLDADSAYNLSATASQRTGTVTIADNEPIVTLSVVDAAAGESTGVANPGQFRVTRPATNTAGDLVVHYTVTGTATAGDDYTTLTGTVTIPAGQTFANFNVTVTDDLIAETSETVIVTLDADSAYNLSATASQRTGTVTIADNEPIVTLSVVDAAAGESTGVANPGQFRVTRPATNTAGDLVVHYTVTGTATAGDDYTTLTGTVTIPAGQTFANFNVTVTDDLIAETSETVIVTLDADSAYNLSATASQRTGTVTITDNEPIVTLSVVDAAAGESTGVANPGQFRVTRPATNTAGDLVVHYTVTGTATNGDDYTSLTGTVTIPAGQTFANFNVTVTDDLIAETSETVIVTLDADSAYNLSATASQRTGTVTIADNEPIVTLSVVDAAAAETLGAQAANGGQFRVTRPATNTAVDLVVHYSMTGTATNGDDYTTLTGTVTIPAGQTSALINVTVTNDTLAEPSETVILTLDADSAYNLSATASQRTGTVTIADNESIITLTASDATAGEVVAGLTANNGNFRVTRTGGDLSQQLTINVLVSGTAGNGDWINFIDTEMVIPAGASFYDNPVIVVDDALWEGTETIVITLQSGTDYHITTVAAQRTATVNIADNESTITVTAPDAAAAEITTGAANPGSFRVTRTGGSNAASLVVNYSIGGTATNGTDITLLTGTVTIPAGAAFVDVPVTVTDDLLAEVSETVVFTLVADPSYNLGAVAQRTATVTIADNEPTVTITAPDAAAAEVGTAAANPGTFRVTRTGGTTAALVVNYTISGTATNGTDYTTLTGTVTIPAGAASATFNVAVTEDDLAELSETVIATLAADPAYRLGTAAQQTATVTIADNEATVTVALRDAAGAEVFTGTANPIVYRISRTGVTTAALVVNYTMSGTATSGTDYGALAGTVTIPVGAAFVDVTLNVTDDLVVEGSETAILTLTADPTYRLGTAAQQAAAATIADNEPTFSAVILDAAGAETPSGTVNTMSYRIARTGGNGQTSVVNFSMTGSATPDIDYVLTMTPVAGASFVFDSNTGLGTVTFTGAVTAVTLVATPALDTIAEGSETAILNLLAADVGAQQYTVSGTQHTATGTIANAVFADLAGISVGNFSANSFSRTGVGQQVTFDVNVENQGTTTLTSVRVTLFLQSAGGVRTSIGTMTFAVNLAPGEATTLSPTLTLSGFPIAGTYTPGATVAILAGGTDVIAGNNSVTNVGTPITVTA